MPGQPRQKLCLRWRPRANRQWNRILTFFAERNRSIDYSEKLDAELHRVLDLICIRPEMGQETKRPNTRRHVVEKRYAVFYRIDGDWIEIVAIIDGRRDRKME